MAPRRLARDVDADDERRGCDRLRDDAARRLGRAERDRRRRAPAIHREGEHPPRASDRTRLAAHVPRPADGAATKSVVDIIGNDRASSSSSTSLRRSRRSSSTRSDPKKDRLNIPIILPVKERAAAFDLSIPVLTPVLVRKKTLAEEIAAFERHGARATRVHHPPRSGLIRRRSPTRVSMW